MGDDDSFSDDGSGANVTGLRHLCCTDSITMDALNDTLSIDEKERLLHRTATEVSIHKCLSPRSSCTLTTTSTGFHPGN